MPIVCTIIALVGTGISTYFGLLSLEVEDRFALPYSVVSTVIVAVVLVHFIQTKMPFVSEVAASIKALAFGVVVTAIMAVVDCILGMLFIAIGFEPSPPSFSLVAYVKAAGMSAVLTALFGWLWVVTSATSFFRAVLLRVFRVES